MRRRAFLGALSSAGALSAIWPLPLRAQQTGKFQIGFLYPGPQAGAPPRIAAVLSGLRAGGVRAEQVEIVPALTGGDPALLAPMAANLVERKLDLIIPVGPAAVRAVRTSARPSSVAGPPAPANRGPARPAWR